MAGLLSISVVTSPTANMKSLSVGNVVFLVGIFAQGYLLGASGMHLESYWESWHIEGFPNDFASFLESVPATPIGSCDGVNYVTIGKLDFFSFFGGGVLPHLTVCFPDS